MLSFEEFKVTNIENVSDRIMRHTAQAGAVFADRGKSLELLKNAEDFVKWVKADIDYKTRVLGYIPVEGDTDAKLKITEAALKAYVDQHPRTKKAREERAEAAKDYDNKKALAQAYLDVKEFLKLLQTDRRNEFYSDPTIKATAEYLNN